MNAGKAVSLTFIIVFVFALLVLIGYIIIAGNSATKTEVFMVKGETTDKNVVNQSFNDVYDRVTEVEDDGNGNISVNTIIKPKEDVLIEQADDYDTMIKKSQKVNATFTYVDNGKSKAVNASSCEDLMKKLPKTQTKSGFVFGGYYFNDGQYQDRPLTQKNFEYIVEKNNDMTISIKWYSAGKIKVYGDLFYQVENSEITIIGTKNFAATEVEIPNAIGGLPVTKVGAGAFNWCTNITTLTLNNNLKKIAGTDEPLPKPYTGYSVPAFNGCGAISRINISSLEAWCNMDKYPFVTDTNKAGYHIGYSLYVNNKILMDLTIPSSIKVIKPNCFTNCTGLNNVTIPNSVERIGAKAFSGCTNICKLSMGRNVKYIGDSAFESWFCAGNVFHLLYPNNFPSEALVIPDSVEEIGNWAFSGTMALDTVYIGSGVKKIGMCAFGYDWRSFTEITDIYYNGTKKQWKKIDINKTGNNQLINATIHCKDGVIEGGQK
ncbi:MAG: leucine-rich repeat domain-containing protein [Clostridia bacterium]|nr:leucine-rich repeat domain-containing protein [Clostridia bacterium]